MPAQAKGSTRIIWEYVPADPAHTFCARHNGTHAYQTVKPAGTHWVIRDSAQQHKEAAASPQQTLTQQQEINKPAHVQTYSVIKSIENCAHAAVPCRRYMNGDSLHIHPVQAFLLPTVRMCCCALQEVYERGQLARTAFLYEKAVFMARMQVRAETGGVTNAIFVC
jgi:hypothetical protein